MKSERDTINLFFGYLKPYVLSEVCLLLFMFISSLGTLATPYILKIIIDDIFPKRNFNDLVLILLVLLTIYILQTISSIVGDIFSTRISKKISSDIRTDIFIKLLNNNAAFFKNTKIGELLYLLTNDVTNVQYAISNVLINLTKNTLVLIGVLILLFSLNIKLTLISLFLLPLTFISIKFFTPYLKDTFTNLQNRESDLSDFLVERLRNFRVIKSYGTINYESNKLKEKHETLVKSHVGNALMNSLNNNVTTFSIALIPIFALIFGGKQVFEGSMTVGTLVAFIQYLAKLFNPAFTIVNGYGEFTKSFVSMKRISSYYKQSYSNNVSKRSIDIIQKIEFENVSLRYGDNLILDNISCKFETGNTYVINGFSGSGKSSLINLVCDFIHPTSGEIKVNDIKINEIENLSDHYSLIEKENQLFHDTIAYNINYDVNKDNNDIRKIIEHVQLDSVINDLSDGLDSTISTSGSFLSDGQKQRISIARAINKSSSLFIFDESTSSLDSQLEFDIINKIRMLNPSSIIIIISHRIETFKLADVVINVENGKLV